MIDLKVLIKNGVHFGHQTSKWSPKMQPYIWGYKNNIHLINVSATAYLLEKAASFLGSMAAEGKCILWVGTKKAAQDIIENASKDLNCPYVKYRWVGGTFSNFRQVKKSVAKLLHYKDIIAKSEQFHYNKKELNTIQKRIDRLEKNVGGIQQLTWPIGAVVVVDVKKEHVCVKEAIAMGIPVVALVDTNSDPSLIQYPIPANDDAPRSIGVIISYLVDAVKQGFEVAATKPQEHAATPEMFESVFETPLLPEDEEEEERKRSRGTQTRLVKKAPATPKPKSTKRVGEEEVVEKDIKPKAKVRVQTKGTAKTESKAESKNEGDQKSESSDK